MDNATPVHSSSFAIVIVNEEEGKKFFNQPKKKDIPMNKQQAEAEVQWALDNWKYTCGPDQDDRVLTLPQAARWMYEHAGNARRFGIELPDEVTRILADRSTIEKALEYFEQEDFLEMVRGFLLASTDDVEIVSVHLDPEDSQEDSEEELEEFAQEILQQEAFGIILRRDWYECTTREIARHLPDDAALRCRFASVCTMLAHTDSIMRAGIERFVPHVATMEAMKAEFVDGAVTQVREWWFFDLGAFERGELLMEEITYGCTDSIRFPEWRVAEYLGGPDSEDERVAVEAHLAQCECCRTSVEHANFDGKL